VQHDGLELLVVLARLEGRRKRQIEGGDGELGHQGRLRQGGGAAGFRRRCGQEQARARCAAPSTVLYRGAGAGALGSHAQAAAATAMAGFGRWALAGLVAGPARARAGRSGSGLRARPFPGR
jgi:hypothetical protein